MIPKKNSEALFAMWGQRAAYNGKGGIAGNADGAGVGDVNRPYAYSGRRWKPPDKRAVTDGRRWKPPDRRRGIVDTAAAAVGVTAGNGKSGPARTAAWASVPRELVDDLDDVKRRLHPAAYNAAVEDRAVDVPAATAPGVAVVATNGIDDILAGRIAAARSAVAPHDVADDDGSHPEPSNATNKASSRKNDEEVTVMIADPSIGPAEKDDGSGGGETRTTTSESGRPVMMEFRALVEKLVAQVMPTEIDQIDELIGEYEGRESELLDTLTSMRDNEEPVSDCSDGEEVAEGAAVEGAAVDGAGLPAAKSADEGYMASSKDSITDTSSTDEAEPTTGHGGVTAASRPSTTPAQADDASHVTEKRSNIQGAQGTPTSDVEAQASVDAAVPANDAADGVDDGGGDVERETDEDRAEKGPRKRGRTQIVVALAILLVLVGACAALGAIFGGGEDDTDAPEEIDEDNFVAKSAHDIDDRTGEEIFDGGRLPTPPPAVAITPGPTLGPTPPAVAALVDYINDVAPPDTPWTCDALLPEENIQDLGVRALDGYYPRVAVYGNDAIVASGTGYVAFYSLEPSNDPVTKDRTGTAQWTRKRTFLTTNNVGDISSVAIMGGTAVVGAKEAVVDLDDAQTGMLQTGAVWIYRKGESTGEWTQLEGAYIPDEYRRVNTDKYDGSEFGHSVDVYEDLIVVGAPEEMEGKGSVTVFRRDDENDNWFQAERLEPQNLCEKPYYGYSVQIHDGVMAASADCDINIVLYKVERGMSEDRRGTSDDGSDYLRMSPYQRLPYFGKQWGTISSIAMSGEHLVYSTVYGGLFFHHRTNDDGEAMSYVRGQETSFGTPVGETLWEYPLSMDGDVLVLSVANDIFLYTLQNRRMGQWEKQDLVLNSEGDFAGDVHPSVALSDGQLLVGSKREVAAHDLLDCTDASAMLTTASHATSGLTTAPSMGSTPTPNPALGSTPNSTVGPTLDLTPPPTPPPTCHNLDVSMTLDQYPSDTRWEIVPQGQNTVVATSPPYDETVQFSAVDVDTVCLEEGTYEFTIYDVFGDGICCKWGEGSYELAFGDNVVASGGAFGESETKTFVTPGSNQPQPSRPATASLTTAGPTTLSPITPSPVPAPPTCYSVYVNLSFDMYSEDESWDISQNGTIIEKSSPYEPGTTQDARELCLDAGDYVFTIYDKYEDGMCCKWGDGSYSVTTISEEVIVGGAEFGASESTAFKLPTAAMTAGSN